MSQGNLHGAAAEMYNRHWLRNITPAGVVGFTFIFAAIIGLSFLYWWGLQAQTKSERDSDYRTHEYTVGAYYPEYETCMRLAAHDKAHCISDAHDAYRTNEREERDLVAQETTAAWTWVMSGAAIFGVILSIFGVFLVWVTFNETRETNKITRAGLQAELMPFLTVEMDDGKFEIRSDGFYEKGVRVTELWFTVKNSGKSAAILERAGRKWDGCPFNEYPSPVQYDAAVDGLIVKECNIPVGGSSSSGPIRCRADLIRPPIDGDIYFHGFLQFSDLKKVRYISGFCIRFAEGRFHLAWPPNNPELYNYHKRMDSFAHETM